MNRMNEWMNEDAYKYLINSCMVMYYLSKTNIYY